MASSHEWKVVTDGGGQVVLGESPTWDARTDTLYWIDIDGRRLHRSTGTLTAGGQRDTIQLSAIPGAIGLVEGRDQWIWVACSDGVHLLDWTSRRSVRIAAFPLDPTFRFNDGKVDPSGEAIVVGTMVTESDLKKRRGAGKFWRISFREPSATGTSNGSTGGTLVREDSGKASVLVVGRTIPNGVEWDEEGTLYWVDTQDALIATVPASKATTTTTPPTLPSSTRAFETKGIRDARGGPIGGAPDGMVIDAQGYLWVAMPGSSLVCRFTPAGALVGSVRLPVSRPTSLCFGGPNMRDLYVTSARKGVADPTKEPLAGCVFRVPLAGQGREMHRLLGDWTRIDQLLASRSPLVTQHTATTSPAMRPPALKSKL